MSQPASQVEPQTWLDQRRAHRPAFYLAMAPVLVAVGVLLYSISRVNYPLFHSIVDGATVFVACSVFLVVWFGRKHLDNHYYLFVAIAFLAFAVLDFVHLLGNKDMGVFPGHGNLGPTFYIASRYVLGAAFLLAPLFIKRKISFLPVFSAYLTAVTLVLLSVFYWRNFPATYIEGKGLTAFKIYSDYSVCLLLLGGLGLLLLSRRAFDARELKIIASALVLSIATGLAFTLWTDPFGITNAVGHFLQLASFCLVFLGFVETSLTKPQDILFWNLKRSNDNIRKLNSELERLNTDLEGRVAERTAELLKAGEKVQAERQRFLDVLETLPVMITLIRPDYHVPFTNKAYREALGEAKGRRCFEYQFNFDVPCKECQAFTPLKTGQPHHWEWTIPTGQTFDIYNFSFTDADGTPMILEMDIDITERRQTERKLEVAHEELALRASQLRALAGELTLSEQRERRRMAIVLHDHLQQYLVAAKFRATALGRTGDESVRKEAVEIERLLDDSIQSSRTLTAELSPPVLHEGGLGAGLEWLTRRIKETYGLIVEVAVEDNLPELAEVMRILLFESVRELLFNTVKHAHARSAAVTAHLADGGDLIITVSDTGSGFDPANLKKAGEMGGGFGLFSIQERLDMMGGTLQIDSAPGKGSRFTLTTPVSKAAWKPVAPPSANGQEQAFTPESGKPIRVFLADDHILT